MTVAQRSLKLNYTHTSILSKETFERGEVFLDSDIFTLRVMNGATPGGVQLLRADLANLSASYTGTLSSNQVTTALGYTPYNGATNPSGYLTAITSSQVTTALGFTPSQLSSFSATTASPGTQSFSYNSTTGAFSFTPYLLPTASTTTLGGVQVDGTSITINNGIISTSGLTSTQVTTALGFTPISSSVTTLSNLTSVGTLGSLAVTGAVSAASFSGALNGSVGATTPNTGTFTTVTSSSTTDATAIGTAAVVLAGGLSVAKQIRAAGNLVLSAGTAAAAQGQGALQVTGGASVSGDLWVQGTIHGTVLGSVSVSAIDNTPIGQVTPSAGGFTNLSVTGTVSGAGINQYVTSKALAFAAAMA